MVETGRPLCVQIQEHKGNLREGHMEKSKLAKYTYKDHRISWEEAKILQIETNNRYRNSRLPIRPA